MADESFVWEPWEKGPGCYSDAPCGLRLTVRWSHAGQFWLWSVGPPGGPTVARGNTDTAVGAQRAAAEAYRRMNRNG